MIEMFGLSEVGGHAVNEDAWDAWPYPHDPGCFLCAVADGMGGQPGGRAAALLALRTCRELLGMTAPGRLLDPETWPALLHQVDTVVADDPEAGSTTLAALAVSRNKVAGASCGDSAAAVLPADGHGVVLTRQQRKNPPVGSGSALFVPFTDSLRPGWTVLAMTDGVWKYVGWEAIWRETTRLRPTELLPALRQRAALPGSGSLQDDFTLVVLRAIGG